MHRIAVHIPLAQSVPAVHGWLKPHRAHALVPPQSIALSPPFWTPSVQLGI